MNQEGRNLGDERGTYLLNSDFWSQDEFLLRPKGRRETEKESTHGLAVSARNKIREGEVGKGLETAVIVAKKTYSESKKPRNESQRTSSPYRYQRKVDRTKPLSNFCCENSFKRISKFPNRMIRRTTPPEKK